MRAPLVRLDRFGRSMVPVTEVPTLLLARLANCTKPSPRSYVDGLDPLTLAGIRQALASHLLRERS